MSLPKMKILFIWSIYDYGSRCSRNILMLMISLISFLKNVSSKYPFFQILKPFNDKSICWEFSMYEHFTLIFVRETTNILSMRKLKYRWNMVTRNLSNIPQLLSFRASIWTHDLTSEFAVLTIRRSRFSYTFFLTY